VVVLMAHRVAPYVPDGRSVPQANLLSGLLLVLVLFILARVFRVGAAMRDDLEGTI
jgi:hypothetical protein